MRLVVGWQAIQAFAIALVLHSAPAWAQSNELTTLFQKVRQTYQLGNYTEAIPLARNYAELTRSQLGETDTRSLIAQKNLIEIFDSAAAVAEAQGQIDEAIRLRLQGLAVAEQAFGPDSLDVASSLAAIGQQYQRLDNAPRLDAQNQDVIELAIGKMLAEADPKLGSMLAEKDKQYQLDLKALSEQILRRALAIRERLLPAGDPDLIASLRQLGDLLATQGRYREAAEFHHRVPPPPAPPLGSRVDFGGVSAPGAVVFFGTDRRADPVLAGSYGSEAGDRNSVGAASIDILTGAGQAGLGATGDGLLRTVDSRRMKIDRVQTLDDTTLSKAIGSKIQLATAFPRQAFVFVHGFSVSFDNALLRTAQLAHDLEFDGPAFVYSWPSHGKLAESDYFSDQRNSLAAADDLRAFLELVVAKSGASHVHLIAHSMGNLVLLKALGALKAGPGWTDLHIGQVVLAAPDMDATEFAAAIPLLRGVAAGITLYASASDRALIVSRLVNGNLEPRAGFVPPQGPIVVEGVDTIDVTAASTDILSLNHNAFAESPVLLLDMVKVLHGVGPPNARENDMRPVASRAGTYWQYQPTGG